MTARELHLTDPVFVPPTSYNALERAALALIRDPRDLPFVWLTLQMTFVLLPTAAFLFWPGNFRWWMAPLYWALLFGVFFDRYILMLHNTSHRPLFKRQYNGLKFYIPWVLGPLCGETPETYYIHHITMHHAEGNLPRDLSSTMKYQRDSALANKASMPWFRLSPPGLDCRAMARTAPHRTAPHRTAMPMGCAPRRTARRGVP